MIEVHRKYLAWCERRKLDPADVHDLGRNGSMRAQILKQAAVAAALQREKKISNQTPQASTESPEETPSQIHGG